MKYVSIFSDLSALMYAAAQKYVQTSSTEDVVDYVMREISLPLCPLFYDQDRASPTDFSSLMPPPCTLRQARADGAYRIDSCHQQSDGGKAMCELLHKGANTCMRSMMTR